MLPPPGWCLLLTRLQPLTTWPPPKIATSLPAERQTTGAESVPECSGPSSSPCTGWRPELSSITASTRCWLSLRARRAAAAACRLLNVCVPSPLSFSEGGRTSFVTAAMKRVSSDFSAGLSSGTAPCVFRKTRNRAIPASKLSCVPAIKGESSRSGASFPETESTSSTSRAGSIAGSAKPTVGQTARAAPQ